MAKLSVIIVNYQVKYFLEQCLQSVALASDGLDIETWVVDNHSNDGSVEMVQTNFPWVKLIANQQNTGFAVANNQAIKASTGTYVLLLNPDTYVAEDTFSKTLAYMDAHPQIGGLGIRMIDGKGYYLPESKRGFPDPETAFYKAIGLTSFFPKSKRFAKYYLGHLPANEQHEVDVLAGAFMLMRRKALDKAGLLDETFFMYGEDIDLSYRLVQAGYKNYYFADSTIVHYKGESTKKGSLNYVKMFYNAMIIFVKKHMAKNKMFVLLLRLSIYLKATTTIVQKVLHAGLLTIIEATLIFLGMIGIKNYWEVNVKYTPDYYPWEFIAFVVPSYIIIWLLSGYFSGAYDRPYKLTRAIRGVVIGSVILAGIYGFLDESYRFSRAMLAIGSAWTLIVVLGLRLLGQQSKTADVAHHRTLVVGNEASIDKIERLLSKAGVSKTIVGFVGANEALNALGTFTQLASIARTLQVQEVIFDNTVITYKQTIAWIEKLGPKFTYKTMPAQSDSLVGSNSKNTAGDLYAVDINLSIASPAQRRNKRVFDVLLATIILILFPVTLVLTKSASALLRHAGSVLIGHKTWVGYDTNSVLPKLKPSVLPVSSENLSSRVSERANFYYARDYSASQDWTIWKAHFL